MIREVVQILLNLVRFQKYLSLKVFNFLDLSLDLFQFFWIFVVYNILFFNSELFFGIWLFSLTFIFKIFNKFLRIFLQDSYFFFCLLFFFRNSFFGFGLNLRNLFILFIFCCSYQFCFNRFNILFFYILILLEFLFLQVLFLMQILKIKFHFLNSITHFFWVKIFDKIEVAKMVRMAFWANESWFFMAIEFDSFLMVDFAEAFVLILFTIARIK